MTEYGECFSRGTMSDHATVSRTPEGLVLTVVEGGRPASFVLDRESSEEMSRSIGRAVERWDRWPRCWTSASPARYMSGESREGPRSASPWTGAWSPGGPLAPTQPW